MDNTNETETKQIEPVKYDNHDYCTTNSKVFSTIKECKYNYDSDSESKSYSCIGNFCISCGENLGDHNPRQYCNKIYCPYEE